MRLTPKIIEMDIMKFVMVANGNRDCGNIVHEIECENFIQAEELTLKKFDEYLKSDDVGSINLFEVSKKYTINRP